MEERSGTPCLLAPFTDEKTEVQGEEATYETQS
jgi:hypothetical protein